MDHQPTKTTRSWHRVFKLDIIQDTFQQFIFVETLFPNFCFEPTFSKDDVTLPKMKSKPIPAENKTMTTANLMDRRLLCHVKQTEMEWSNFFKPTYFP